MYRSHFLHLIICKWVPAIGCVNSLIKKIKMWTDSSAYSVFKNIHCITAHTTADCTLCLRLRKDRSV